MNFKLYRNFGALNSGPIFDAVEQGLKYTGHQIVENNEDVSVIWSVLWNGRMAQNQKIYQNNKALGRPTLIIEVGNLFRGKTWRLSLQHINSNGNYGNGKNLDKDRPNKLGVHLRPFQSSRNKKILIACQHEKSLQWEGMPEMHKWVNQTITKIRQYSDRRIDVRPHPRCPLRGNIVDADVIRPKQIIGTYDDFDIDYDYHCVINFNSGPCVQAAIQGIPIICDVSSLAYKVSDKIENIEDMHLPERQEWLVQLSHTEWSVQEIVNGVPILRLFN